MGTERKDNVWVSWPSIIFYKCILYWYITNSLRHHLDTIQTSPGLSVSGDELIPNLLVKMYIGHDSSAFAFSSSALNAKKRLCLGVSGLCLGVSEWDLRVCGDVLIPNLLAQIHIYVMLAQILPFPPVPSHICENTYIWGCLDGVWGVWIVSGSYLRVSGRCLGCMDVIWIENNWTRVIIWICFLFSQWPPGAEKEQNGHFTLFTVPGGFFGPRWLIFVPNGQFWSTTKC